jgi:cell wall-associated NlpC family hydrolase
MQRHQGESSVQTRQLTSEAHKEENLRKQLLFAATIISSLFTFSAPAFAATHYSRVSQYQVQSNSTTTQLPPGVSYDSGVQALAPLNSGYQTKLDAVKKVAQSKLGTPYIWGHSEDRGQYGFDCSNFTAYVYHHALGYRMSGSSQTQYQSVGWNVPVSQMRPGDLLVFNHGGHVGIYIGNGQMIQEGGGLKKVGYLKVSPGSYWYNHISAVKRMF